VEVTISKEKVSLDRKDIELVLRVQSKLEDFAQGDFRYGESGIVAKVTDLVSAKIEQRIMDEMSDEIIKKIDLEMIIKRVQLRIVDRIGATR
jgi:hypothetical protein